MKERPPFNGLLRAVLVVHGFKRGEVSQSTITDLVQRLRKAKYPTNRNAVRGQLEAMETEGRVASGWSPGRQHVWWLIPR